MAERGGDRGRAAKGRMKIKGLTLKDGKAVFSSLLQSTISRKRPRPRPRARGGEERAAVAEKLFDGSGECSMAWRWRAEESLQFGSILTGIESIHVEDTRNRNRSGENGLYLTTDLSK